jgi:hypothetical protein
MPACDGCSRTKSAIPDVELHVIQSDGNPPTSGINTKTGILVQNSANATDGSIITIMAGNAGNSQFFFGDTDNEMSGRFTYAHGSDTMRFFTAGEERVRIDASGNIGINTTTLNYPLTVGTGGTNGNGAYLTAGGTWTNGSSREFKKDVSKLSTDDALSALAGLDPVRFRYILEPDEEYVGFIAEDVPELVATSSRKHLSPMDIVAVLTKVVQEQQQAITEQQQLVEEQQMMIDELKQQFAELDK